jgi:hypothetical protein
LLATPALGLLLSTTCAPRLFSCPSSRTGA